MITPEEEAFEKEQRWKERTGKGNIKQEKTEKRQLWKDRF